MHTVANSHSDSNSKDRTIAALLTLLFAGVMLLVMFLTHLRYTPPTPEELAKMDLLQDTIMWGGEFVELGDFPEPMPDNGLSANGEDQPQDAQQDINEKDAGQNDLKDEGGVANEPPKPMVQQHKQESPMKVEQQQRKPQPAQNKTATPQQKPTKAGDNQTKTTTKPVVNKNKPAQPNKFDSKMKNAFGKNNGTGTGKQGDPNGTPGGKLTVGAPSFGGELSGYTLEHFPTKPAPGRGAGTVVLKVTVSPNGTITSAQVTGGSCSDPANRALCRSLALSSKFRVPVGRTTSAIGFVTYHIK